MAIAGGSQVLVAPADWEPHPPGLLVDPAGKAVVSRAGAHWQGLRLFGRGRHPRTFESGAEQSGVL